MIMLINDYVRANRFHLQFHVTQDVLHPLELDYHDLYPSLEQLPKPV